MCHTHRLHAAEQRGGADDHRQEPQHAGVRASVLQRAGARERRARLGGARRRGGEHDGQEDHLLDLGGQHLRRIRHRLRFRSVFIDTFVAVESVFDLKYMYVSFFSPVL